MSPPHPRAVALAAALSAAALAGCPKAVPQPGDPLEDLSDAERERFESGREVFERTFTPPTGLGPLFNATGCAECHGEPVSGGASGITELHVTTLGPDEFCDHLADRGGPVYQQRVTDALREALGIDAEPVPGEATDRALRTSPDLLGFGLLDAIPDSVILALADPEDADGDGISGRPNRFFDGRVGRFGRKALVPSLLEFNEGAFPVEQGVTTPNLPDEGTVSGDSLPEGTDPASDPEASASDIERVDAFVRFLAPPARLDLDDREKRGERLFTGIGCASCHVPTLRTGPNPVDALANREVHAYTDLLLHDMGPELADVCFGVVARPAEFRTEPLMGLRLSRRFLHDGRASSIAEAIALHGGEASSSREAFRALSSQDRESLLAFLAKL
ncbi:MAG: di-heme oxidoredictase family protein [Gemmatimonadota bacterium]